MRELIREYEEEIARLENKLKEQQHEIYLLQEANADHQIINAHLRKQLNETRAYIKELKEETGETNR